MNGNFNPQRAGSCLRARLGDETSASSRATDKAEHWIRDAELMDGATTWKPRVVTTRRSPSSPRPRPKPKKP